MGAIAFIGWQDSRSFLGQDQARISGAPRWFEIAAPAVAELDFLGEGAKRQAYDARTRRSSTI